jgi:hypothetical protein
VSPWVSILIRRCFGMAGALHGPKGGDRLNHRFAWPSARWGSIPIEGGVMAAHKAEIEAAPDPAAKRAELEAHYLAMTSPFRTAEKFGVLDIIDPRETRRVLCDWVEDAWYDIHAYADVVPLLVAYGAAASSCPACAASAPRGRALRASCATTRRVRANRPRWATT